MTFCRYLFAICLLVLSGGFIQGDDAQTNSATTPVPRYWKRCNDVYGAKVIDLTMEKGCTKTYCNFLSSSITTPFNISWIATKNISTNAALQVLIRVINMPGTPPLKNETIQCKSSSKVAPCPILAQNEAYWEDRIKIPLWTWLKEGTVQFSIRQNRDEVVCVQLKVQFIK